jgi:hypothetical protein
MNKVPDSPRGEASPMAQSEAEIQRQKEMQQA